MEQPWRTLSVESADKLRLQDGCLLAENEDSTALIPLGQLRTILLNSQRSTISAALLSELCRRNIAVIVCGPKKTPVGELTGFSGHTQAAGRLQDQCRWTEERKELLWQKIVENKLKMQKELLVLCGRAIPDGLERCIQEVQRNDSSNREGLGAELYFAALFGNGFRRHSADDTNTALNYGYAVIRSALNRILALHGYHTALGIHHCSRDNLFCLSCDLMEPFRPCIDRIVSREPTREPDRSYKAELASVLNDSIQIGDRTLSVYAAMERFTLQAAAFLNGEREKVEEVSFDGTEDPAAVL